MRTYKKKPLLYTQQIELFKFRGLLIPDEAKAERYLNEISYYRLSAYALPFQKEKDKFDDGTTFQDVIGLYLFDRELRLLVLDAIERIEIAIRSQLITLWLINIKIAIGRIMQQYSTQQAPIRAPAAHLIFIATLKILYKNTSTISIPKYLLSITKPNIIPQKIHQVG